MHVNVMQDALQIQKKSFVISYIFSNAVYLNLNIIELINIDCY